jgi:hypothetical protein
MLGEGLGVHGKQFGQPRQGNAGSRLELTAERIRKEKRGFHAANLDDGVGSTRFEGADLVVVI